ncbi:glycosyltransferase [Mycobacterium sp. RTGN5]|uniref:glycosyltransferase n=1 Tax=Mycobacterium sp. RTGN5 TaxID=3016522 RepID=UPI0029C825DD|nr:glycosyltransferase [Mycobacterium sp. RTGN5]
MGRVEIAERDFAAQVFAATALALSGSETSSHLFDVADVPVGVEFASPATSSVLLGALRHLEDPGSPAVRPEVRLQVWDSASTGVRMPPPPVPRSAFTDRGDLVGFGNGRYLVAFHWSEFSVCVLDRETGRGVYWVQDVGNLPYWTRSAPLRTLLHWILMDRGRHLVHGAVVGDEKAAVLLVGRGGSGKSSTALQCLAAGMQFLGDDYVAIAADPPRAYSLFSTAKVAPSQRWPTGRLLMPPGPGDEKVVLALDGPDAHLPRKLPLSALATLRFGDGEASAVEAVDPSALLHAATFTTLAQLPHAGAPLHRMMCDILAQVTTTRIRLGRNPESVVATVRSVVAGQSVLEIPESDARPLVSVVIPVHNGARFLADAVASILAQEYPELELIVVDDGSIDDLQRAVAELPVDVTYLRQLQQGPAGARNTGIASAQGEFVAFLDVDDLWPAGALDKLVRTIVDEGCDVVTGWAQMALYDESTSVTTRFGNPEASFPYYIGAGLYRRSVFDTVGVFDPDMQYGEDTDWFARLHESGRMVHRLPLATLVVRRHSENMTRDKDLVELGVVRAVKKSLDRHRLRES